jgi:hypothetical protein
MTKTQHYETSGIKPAIDQFLSYASDRVFGRTKIRFNHLLTLNKHIFTTNIYEHMTYLSNPAWLYMPTEQQLNKKNTSI